MPKIVAVASAFPPHTVSQAAVRQTVARLFHNLTADSGRDLSVFDNSRIMQRQLMRPLEWYCLPHPPEEQIRIYQEEGLELARQAAHECLEKAGCTPSDVSAVIFVSSTGLATPTLDAYLVQLLGMSRSTVRIPIWGLGCAAGAAGLARASDYCLGHPDDIVLIVALECCSLTFLPHDLTKKNLVATALFGDGAAAALVVGDGSNGSGPSVTATRSHLFPESYGVMGWEFVEAGMRLVLSPRLPAIVKNELPLLLDSFLADNSLDRADVLHYITHPGGAKVLDAYRDALGLQGNELALSEKMLSLHGNVSSVSVLLVLEKWLEEAVLQKGNALLSAFGPGFSAEMLLLGV